MVNTASKLGVAALAAVLLTGAIAVVRQQHGATAMPTRANARPSKLPAGPTDDTNVVAGADGTRMSCPSGQKPDIFLQNAAFTPPLVGGRSFVKGRYHIVLRGTAGNDTTAAITVLGVLVTLGGHEWHPAVTAPKSLRQNTGGDVSIDGTYDSPGPSDAGIHASLQWQWQAAMLRPCGVHGLIEDD